MARTRHNFHKYDLEVSLWIPWFLGAFFLLVFRLLNSSRIRRSQRLPPGPRGLPFIGNVFQIPMKMPWFKFADWAQEFGPVFSLNMAGRPIILLNTFKAAADLLDHRSSIYSDRPRYIVAGDILTGGIALVFARYGPSVRKLRRAAHEGFNARAIEAYYPIFSREAALATLRILQYPERFADHINRSSTSALLSVVYSWPSLTDKEEALVRQLHDMGETITKGAIPGAYLVEFIPALRHLPLSLAKWKREGIQWHRQTTDMLEGFVTQVKEQSLTGDAPPSFVSELLKTKERHGLTEKEVAWLAGVISLAGAEAVRTILSNPDTRPLSPRKPAQTLLYFIQAMLLYPDVMHKAQTELDNVVGRERAPTFEDQKSLPYIQAVLAETLCWRPPAPIDTCISTSSLAIMTRLAMFLTAVPRNVTEDDSYEGYFIPKGATIITNIWAMNRDPKLFPDFDEFRPERFFTGVPGDTHSLDHASFGFGRRTCIGNDLANQVLFMTIATLLWALNIDKDKDSNGDSIIPSKHEFVEAGLALGPAPFKCRFSPRFSEVSVILQSSLPENNEGR